MEEPGDGAAPDTSLFTPRRDERTGARAQRVTPSTQAHRESAPRTGRKTKANIHIGSLNMNGRSGIISPNNQKWNELNQLMREAKIGILCLQETHLTKEDEEMINRLYGRRITLHNSSSESASSTQGVSIVLNRELVDVKGIQFSEIIPGRAMILRMHWHADKYLTIMNVYAPNPALW